MWTPYKSIPPALIGSENTILVSASAGTGKTTTIINMIEYLIERGTDPRNIMFVTYNTNIANEFKDRLLSSGLAKDKSDLRYIGTWHALGRRFAQAQKLLPQGQVRHLDKKEQPGELSTSVAQDMAREFQLHDTTTLKAIFFSISDKTSRGLPLSARENGIYQALLNYQRDNSCITFLSMLRELLTRKLFDPDISHVFVDEAQDMGHGHAQYLQHLLSLPSPPKLVLAGDEKQQINGYMGSEYEAFVSFPSSSRNTLTATFRLPRAHYLYSNDIFLRANSTAFVGMTQSSEVEHEGVLEELPLFSALNHLREATKQGRSTLFLARHNATLDTVREIFTQERIPFKDKDVTQQHLAFAREHAICVRKNVITPHMVDILNPLRGRGESGALNVAKKKGAPYVDHQRRDEHKHQQRELSSAQRSLLFNFDEINALAADISPTDTKALERVGLTPRLAHDLLSNTIDFSWFVGNKDSYVIAMQWIKEYGEDFTPVELKTIHSAKGLEADVVLLCSETYGPSLETERTDPDAERRVWYVGATRSKHSLYIVSLPMQRFRTSCLPPVPKKLIHT